MKQVANAAGQISEFWTEQQTASYLGLAQVTVKIRRQRGRNLPPAYRFGRRVMYRASEVQAWAEAQRIAPQGAAVRPRGITLAQRFSADLEDLREHEKQQPAEVEALVAHLIAHVRSWKPESVSPLGTLPAPEAPIRDPRT